ncbi:hypothetical protein EB235_19790 [Mesorhizobium loti R88b]|uniref:Uncharacterized protein n=1 Tax=Mesorhizobium loti R88b TaxID=935548 RepID=A0A6M7WU97_RHILI|nr:hypothetical protein EB235_19790 [Mesorhizobium loti R88b]
MIGIAKVAGILSVAIGVVCILAGVFGGARASVAFAQTPLWALGLSSIVSGSVLYCVGLIAENMGLMVDHLAAIRRNQEAAGPQTRVPPLSVARLANLGDVKGLFQDR